MQVTNSPFYHQLVPRCSVNKQDDQFVPLHSVEMPAFKRKKREKFVRRRERKICEKKGEKNL